MVSAAIARGDVFTWECDSFPVEGGWGFVQEFCEPVTWIENGIYVQQLDMSACPGEDEGAQDVYRNSIAEFVGVDFFFLEYRLQTSGDRSEIPGGAPAALATWNSFGIGYHMNDCA